MVSVTSLLALAYVGCGLAPLALVPTVRRHREKPGSTGLVVALIGLSIWSVAYGLAITTTSYGTVLALGSLVIFGGQLAAIGYLFLALEYTDTAELTPRFVDGVIVVVVLVQLLSLTDPLHELLWGETARPIIDVTATEPLASVVIGAVLLVAAAAALLLAVDAISGPNARRSQSLALVAAGVPPLAMTIADIYVIGSVMFSLLPFGVAISVFAIAWALFRANLLEIVPVGRRRIVEEMTDAAIVLDGDDRVVECNPAARQLTEADGEYAGMPVERFFSTVPDAVDRFRGSGVDTEITVAVNGQQRDFHLQHSPLDDSRPGVAAGRLVVLRDITALKRRERALEHRETELEFVSQLLTRVLRHNLRNELSVVRGYAAMIADDGGPSVAPMASEIVETSDDLLSTSRNARTIQHIIDGDDCPEYLDLAGRLEELVTAYQTDASPVTISLTAPDYCPIETDPGLEYAFDILLETALEHADTPQTTIGVRLDRGDDHATVTITDEGGALPQTELAVFAESDEQLLEQTNEIGLWIVNWIVDRSSASIAVDTGREENRVSIQIPSGNESTGDDPPLYSSHCNS